VSFHLNSGMGGWGMVVRNAKGEVLEVGVGHLQHLSSPLHAETLAAMRCLERVTHWGMSHVLLETDSTSLSEAMSSPNWDRSPLGSLFKQNRDLMRSEFVICKVSVCSRVCNRVADCSSVADNSRIFLDHAPDLSLAISGDNGPV
jgi:ribonuclease HI